MSSIITDQAKKADILELKKLISQFSPIKEDGFEKRLDSIITGNSDGLFVARVDGQLVGYAWVQSYGPHLRSGDITARFNDLFVIPEFRKQKVGTKLFEAVKEWAKNYQVKYLQWQAGSDAIQFYEKLGLKGDTKSDLETHPFYEIEF